MKHIVLDFETRSLCDLKAAGAPRYAQDATTEVLCLCWADAAGGPWEDWEPGQPIAETSLFAEIANGCILIAHKASFEKSIWRYIMVPDHGWPDVPNSRWHDTMAMCAMRSLPLDLDGATRTLRLENEKDKVGNKLTIGLSKLDKKTGMLPVITPSIQARVVQYCGSDISAQVGLHNRLGWLPGGERSVWLLDQRINERGFRIDLPLIRTMERVVAKATKPLAEEFTGLTGLSFTQDKAFKAWLHSQGVHLDNLQAQSVAEAVGHSPDLDPDDLEFPPLYMPEGPKRALEIRQLVRSSAVKKLERAQQCVMDDSRVRDSLQYHGAMPGLWAGRLIQPHNFPRGTIKGDPEAKVAAIMTGDPDYVELLYGPPVEVCVSSLRHIITASAGRLLLAGDFSGIQARITLALSGAHTKTALMASGADVYCDMASSIYGRPITKADQEERQIGKNSVLGLGFGMGWFKFQWKYARDHDEEFCRGVVDTYRKHWAPEVPRLWYALMDAARSTVYTRRPHEAYGCIYRFEDRWLTCELPSGRKLWYFNPQPIREAMPWDDTDIREGFTFQATKMNQRRTVKAFGGLLCENVASGLAADLLRKSMRLCEDNALPVVLTVHDEVLSEPLERHADPKLMHDLMVDKPDWCVRYQVPIDVDVWSEPAMRYRK